VDFGTEPAGLGAVTRRGTADEGDDEVAECNGADTGRDTGRDTVDDGVAECNGAVAGRDTGRDKVDDGVAECNGAVAGRGGLCRVEEGTSCAGRSFASTTFDVGVAGAFEPAVRASVTLDSSVNSGVTLPFAAVRDSFNVELLPACCGS
jgi:hypothetical protein